MQLTWDLIILLFTAVLTIYGALLGKNKIVSILVNVYIALAVTLILGDSFHSLISNFEIISNNLASSAFGAKMLLVVIITALLTFKSELSAMGSPTISKVQGGIYGFLTSGLIFSSAFYFMSNAEMISLDSNFAIFVLNYQWAWVLAPVVLMIIGGFIKR